MPEFRPPNISRSHLFIKQGLWCVALVLLGWCVWFSAFYFTTGYNTLKSWFLSLNGCIYRQEHWASEFFTPAVKDAGNKFALAAGVVSVLGILYMLKIRKQFLLCDSGTKSDTIPLLWYIPVIGLGFGLWYWGNGLVAAAYDEVFSAVNCAETHPFQAIAYYMLPNNHMYFNLLNGLFFRWMGDHVLSGRIFSMVAYCGVLCVAFSWLCGLLNNRLLALLSIIPIALQFTIWGFSFQARGYEWQLLSCWIAFVTILKYEQSHNIDTLRINTFFCVLGFILVPTFLYYYVAQLLFMLLAQVFSRRFDFRFWQYQLSWGVAVFLCYTPGFCFSGVQAFTGNQYVKEAFPDMHTFWPAFTEVTLYLINFCFSFIIQEGNPINYVLFLLPIVLLFMQRRQRMIGVFYVLLWVIYTVVVLYMKRVPFNRNMILHYSLTLVIVIYTLYSIIDLIIKRLNAQSLKMAVKVVLYMLPIVWFSYHLFEEDRKNVSLNLYFYDLNTLHDSTMADMAIIPKGSSIGCSDEGFYWYYYGRKMNYRTTFCPAGNEDYYVKRDYEPLPGTFNGRYELVRKGYHNHEIYKRKTPSP